MSNDPLNPIFPSPDNDRPDIQLERDRQQGIRSDNYWKKFHEQPPIPEFSSDPESLSISQIVRNLILKGGGKALYYKDQIFWDKDSISDAIDDLCLECLIPEDWEEPLTSQDQISYHELDKGHEYEIILEIFKE